MPTLKVSLALVSVSFLVAGASEAVRASERDQRDQQVRAADLQRLDSRVISRVGARDQDLAGMLARDARARVQAANVRENAAWANVKTRADWEKYRDARLQA